MALMLACATVPAADANAGEKTSSRFVSLKGDKVFLREGPSFRHRIRWVYVRDGLPVEVIAEYDVWRRVRDSDGEIGWIHRIMLSSERTVLIMGEGQAMLTADVASDSAPAAYAEPGVVAKLETCAKTACEVSVQGIEGWIDRSRLWGVHDGEVFE